MKKAAKVMFGGALLALVIGGTALARGPHSGMRELVKELDLNPEQQEMAQDIRDNARAGRQDMMAEKERLGDALMDELEKEQPDRERVHSLIDEGFEAVQEMVHARVDEALDLHATFSPEQRETLVEGMEEMRERRAQHSERGHRGHHGGE